MKNKIKILSIIMLMQIIILLVCSKTYAYTENFSIPIESSTSLEGIRTNIYNEIVNDGYTGDSNFVVGETGNNRTWTGSNGTVYNATIVITRDKQSNESKKYTATITVSEENPSSSATSTYNLIPNSAKTLDDIRSNIISTLTPYGYEAQGRDEFATGTKVTRTWTNTKGTQSTATIYINAETVTENAEVYNATVKISAEVQLSQTTSSGKTSTSQLPTGTASGVVNPIEDPDHYKPAENNESDNTRFTEIGSNIIGVIRLIGTALSVITLVTLGIRYMMGSTQDKALYKETMIPYIIGAIMVFAIPNIIGILYSLITENFTL